MTAKISVCLATVYFSIVYFDKLFVILQWMGDKHLMRINEIFAQNSTHTETNKIPFDILKVFLIIIDNA